MLTEEEARRQGIPPYSLPAYADLPLGGTPVPVRCGPARFHCLMNHDNFAAGTPMAQCPKCGHFIPDPPCYWCGHKIL